MDAEEQEASAQMNATGDKFGGWPHWHQDPEWPKDSLGQKMVFLTQLDNENIPYYWGDSSIAYLFISEDSSELELRAQSL